MGRLTPWLVLLTAACGARAVDLDGRPCATGDPPCLPGYECDLGICVSTDCQLGRLESCGSCEQDCTVDVNNATPVCVETSAGNFDCDYQGTCNPETHDVDGERNTGCECTTTGAEVCDNADNDCNGSVDDGIHACQCTNGPPSDSDVCDGIDNDCNGAVDDGPGIPCAPNEVRDCNYEGRGPTSGIEECTEFCIWSDICNEKDLIAPPPVTTIATPLDGAVGLDWTYPNVPDLGECVIVRKTGTAPTGRTDGTVVHRVNNPTGGIADDHNDVVSNGTLYWYAIYCRDHSLNWQTDATAASAQPMATPPANPVNLQVGEGDGQLTAVFNTPPSTFDQCILVRKTGSAPAHHLDVDIVLETYTTSGPQTYTDTGLANSTEYFYAVFCHTEFSWNENTVVDRNLASAIPRAPNDCDGDDTVSIESMAIDCGHYAGGDGLAPMIGLTLWTDCDNQLTSLTVHVHPASTLDGEVSTLELYREVDGSLGDRLQQASLSGGTTVTFTGLSVALTSTPIHLVMTANIGDVEGAAFVAWEVGSGDIVLLDDDPNVVLEGGDPLVSPTHTLRTGRCPDPPAASDLGAATVGAISVESLQADNATWGSGAGDDSDWVQVGADFASPIPETSDCQLTTAGTPTRVHASDYGGSSVVLRINTGIPLGLPLCGLRMRVYGTPHTGKDCSYDELTAYSNLFLYYYISDHTVAGEISPDIAAQDGPSVSGCVSDFADFDLSGLYQAASADGSLNQLRLRAIFDGGNINQSSDATTTVPDIFFRVVNP